jgi:predicted porin
MAIATNDELIQVLAGVDYRLSERFTVSLNYEGVFWNLQGSGWFGRKPVWNYLTLGVGYDLGENTALNVLYQILDTDGKGTPAPVQRRSCAWQEQRRGGCHHA